MHRDTLLLVAALALSLWAVKRVNSNSVDNENLDPFSALCGAVNLAQATPQAVSADTQSEQLCIDILAANISVGDQNFTDDILEEQTWDSLTAAQKADRKGWEPNWKMWTEAKKSLKTRNKDINQQWQKLQNKETTAARVKLLADEAIRLWSRAQKAEQGLDMHDVKEELNLALYGAKAKPASFKPIPAGSNRAEVCGKHNDENKNQAGTSLMLDVTCLCAKHDTSTSNQGKACVETCTDNSAAQQPTPDGEYLPTASALLACCNSFAAHSEMTASTVAAAIGNFLGKLKHKQGSTTKQNYVLGELDSTGEAGCTGNKASNGGKCAAYKATLFKKGGGGIPWAGHLMNAAQKLQNKYKTLSALHTIEAQLRLLNTTVHSYLYQNPNQAPSTPTASEKKQLPTEEECNKHTKSEKCNDPCKWNEDATDKTKKCSLDPQKAAEQQATQAGTAGGNGETKTTDKCGAAKTPEECAAVKGEIPKDKKAVCGWIEGKCQDSSILVTKKIALGAAAFMALLF